MALASWTEQQIYDQMIFGRKWGASTISFGFATNTDYIATSNNEAPGFSAMTQLQQARASLAISLWDDLIAPKTALAANAADALVLYAMTSSMADYALTYKPGNGSVWFNSNFASGDDDLVRPAIGLHGFETYIHETGHALGLDHMGNYNENHSNGPSCFEDSTVYSVMSYYGPSWLLGKGDVAWADWTASDGVDHSAQTPMLNDIRAIQQIYGADTTTRTGGTVYGFGATVTDASRAVYDFSLNPHPVLCIYDAGGVDTLNLSGFATPSVINLTPGSFSDCDAMTNNISIAFGTFIENATGGAKADRISGNALANVLTGNGGSDVLTGFGGGDSFYGGAGNDSITGGAGVDTAYFSGRWANIAVGSSPSGMTVYSSLDGTDTLNGIEYVVDGAGVRKSVYDLVPSFSIAGPVDTVWEGTGGTTTVSFTITLSKFTIADQTVDWALSFSEGQAAADDFSGPLTGSAYFEGGTVTATVSLSIVADETMEAPESFSVVLSNPSSGIAIGTGTATATIEDDDFMVMVDDPIYILGLGDDEWIGSEEAERLFGMAGNDLLNAGGGDDQIIGGTGLDTLTGGAGNDLFRFGRASLAGTSDSACDVITDFEPGIDHIYLRSVYVNAATPERDRLSFIGTAAISTAPGGELRYQLFDNTGTNNDYTMIYGDTDADTGIEFAIKLKGLVILSAGDFVL